MSKYSNNFAFLRTTEVGIWFSFSAFNRSFDIKAAKGFHYLPVMDPKAVLVIGNVSQTLQGDFFVGRHVGYPRCGVEGYMIKDIPKATITCPEDTYVVEPAQLLFHSSPDFNAVVTRESDILGQKCQGNVPCYKVDSVPMPILHESTPSISKVEYQTVQHEYYLNSVCGVHLVADHTLSEHHKNNVFVIKQEMISWLRKADQFFSATDFNGDGIADNVRLVAKKMTILSSNSPGYGILVDPRLTVDKTLLAISAWNLPPENGEFCLTVVYVSRDWETTNGVAFQGKPLPGQGGGICNLVGDPNFRLRPMRTSAVLMTNVVGGEFRPHINMAATTAHEVGHAFGSPHDNDKEEFGPRPPCGYDDRAQQYLMNSFSGPMITKRNQLFSPCSIATILPVIRNKGTCLEPESPPRCGDGIIQPGEHCDCGDTEEQCKLLDNCCTPGECRVAKHHGHICSPATEPCCTVDCRIYQAGVQCSFSAEECQGYAYCDGVNPLCPVASPAEDGRPCGGGMFVCQGGVCGHTGCAGQERLQLCRCVPPLECTVCCQEPGFACVPAHTLGLPNIQHPVNLGHGTPCGRGGFCDRWGNCRSGLTWGITDRLVMPPVRSSLSRTAEWMVDHWLYILIAVLLLVLVILLALGYRKNRKRAKGLHDFNQAVEEEVRRLGRSKDASLVGPLHTEVSRLKVLFPGVSTKELIGVCKEEKSERHMVRNLLQKGHPLRTEFTAPLAQAEPPRRLKIDTNVNAQSSK